MNIEITANRLSELGHITRLGIYRELIKAGNMGIAVGQLQSTLHIPHSTLSHHLSRLLDAGLITQQREGTTLFCVAQCDALNDVLTFLTEECCIDENCCNTLNMEKS